MYFVDSSSTDPYYNLALEEFLFTTVRDDDIFMLWQNEPSIIAGKYQNVFEEINIKAVMEDGVKLVRRNSGGGTVYHDLGNLNYSIIMDFDPDTLDGYDLFLAPVIQALGNMGVSAERRRSCDIVIGDDKISGSAQYVKKGRILHHGTLLFDADLEALRKYLRPTDAVITSKAVKSVRSRVTNVAEHVERREGRNWNIADVKDKIKQVLPERQLSEICLDEEDKQQVLRLVKEKYGTWEWNYGKSPKFTLERRISTDDGEMNISVGVNKGYIIECRMIQGESECGKLEKALPGCRYEYSDIYTKIRTVTGKPCRQCEKMTDMLF